MPMAMPPKRLKIDGEDRSRGVDEGMFNRMVVFLVHSGVQPRRLQVWKQKLEQMGAKIERQFSRRVTHVFANNLAAFKQGVGQNSVDSFKGKTLACQWLEGSLKQGEKMNYETYNLVSLENTNGQVLSRSPSNLTEKDSGETKSPDASSFESSDEPNSPDTNESAHREMTVRSPKRHATSSPLSDGNRDVEMDRKDQSSLYPAPDLNKNITEIFGKLINIYRALGDDRRSFSYYKAVSVIEKLPFQINCVDQVKDLPSIGKSMQDHIHEIITTGKLSKLEHFESDEKVRTVTLFGEVWGIGPATAFKLYEKGHRSLDDLEKEDSLTKSQRLGLKYFDDIKTRIPREEVKHMESLLQKAGELILPGVLVLCGGSYRRGKATCGDMDIVITHPDGESHKGFLPRYVKHLKEINFLKEDLIFSVHSVEGTDSGVDTYFGLCTYPGRELRHRIDLKVYPRDIYAFGLIAWTGNDVLNRRLRLLADSKGYKLDDTGLYLATQSSGGKKGAKSRTSLKFHTEKEVFDYLEFPWLEPHERNL